MLQHYTGMVAYNAERMLDKNVDTMERDTAQMFGASTAHLVAEVGALPRTRRRKWRSVSHTVR